MTDVGNPARLPFYEEFTARARAFAHEVLQAVPELNAVAIVPAWAVRQEHLASGILVGREGPFNSPMENVKLAEALHLAQRELLQGSFNILKAVDRRMGEMAKEIQERERKLQELIAKEEELSRGGTPPSGPGPGGD